MMMFYDHRKDRKKLQAVIFDWAGTTVDYGSFAPVAVFLRLFESRGVKISEEDVRHGMGLMKKDHLRQIITQPGIAEAWMTVHQAPCTEQDVDELFADFLSTQVETLRLYAEPISGLADTVNDLRRREMKIGSTTGYTRAMMDVLIPEAAKRGYEPDCVVCSDEVPAGRPYPWMCFQNAMQLGVYPMHSMVKVGDTIIDVEEGVNAGMWVVALSMSGNMLGLSEIETRTMPKDELMDRRVEIEKALYQAGAHIVINGIWDLPIALDEIERRVAAGYRP
jgi:phosphonoacetaldehyde hydrolase